MKQIITILGLFLSVHFLSAKEEKLRVAVFDPTSSSISIDAGTKEAVRELISSAFVNTGKYNMVERSMLQQIMKEQKMSNTDAFDDTQATELGKLAGAHKVVLSVVSMVGGRNMLSIKIIDVKTATIDQQKTKVVNTNDLLDAVDPLTAELLGVQTTPSSVTPSKSQSQRGSQSNQQAADKNQPNKNSVASDNKSCGIEFMEQDLFSEKTTWTDKDCPSGWRLPTRSELECMCRLNKKIKKEANFNMGPFSNYFTKEFDPKGKVYIRSFDDCKESRENAGTVKGFIRCVKDR